MILVAVFIALAAVQLGAVVYAVRSGVFRR